MHRSLNAPLSLLLVLALCLLLPGAALAGKGKKKGKKDKHATYTEERVEERDHPGNGLGPGGVPAVRDDLYELRREVEQLARALDASNEATRAALRRIANQLQELGDASDDHQSAIERIANVLQSLDMRVSDLDMRVADLEMLASDDDMDGLSENLGDCDDENPDVSPLMFEVPDNGIDDDCDFDIDELEGDMMMPPTEGETAP